MRCGGVGLAEVLEHEGGGVDGGQRVGDALARRCRGRRRAPARRATVPVRAGFRLAEAAKPMPPADRAGQVGEDVAEEVVGDDDVVAVRAAPPGRCRRRRRGCSPRSTSGYSARDLVDGPVPQVAGEGEHVRLVHQGEVVAAARPASSKAKRTQRSTPMRVFTEPWVATSCGVPLRRNPPSPA